MNFTPGKADLGWELDNNNNVNRRFAGCKLKPLVATGDDETQ
ncbi:MAG TPA: hypothetical protein VG146_08750 [Verrucomicrobiae bacterium]|nr:hypothetical protein [Verrucomicrobiae bacterium]